MAKTININGWPRRLRPEVAAVYVGESLSTFKNGVKSGLWPKPRRKGRIIYWNRPALDEFIDKQDGGNQDGSEWDATLYNKD